MPEFSTERLRLEPAGPQHASDLVRLHADEVVAFWYDETLSPAEASERAAAMAGAWETDGVSKWMAYERRSGALVGRGGLSRLTPDNPATHAITALVGQDWARDRLELGWALLTSARGKGYATEIGRAGLAYGFDTLGAATVVAFTERINRASRAVMERLGMTFAGEFAGPGLVEGRTGVHDDAPFAVYAAVRP